MYKTRIFLISVLHAKFVGTAPCLRIYSISWTRAPLEFFLFKMFTA